MYKFGTFFSKIAHTSGDHTAGTMVCSTAMPLIDSKNQGIAPQLLLLVEQEKEGKPMTFRGMTERRPLKEDEGMSKCRGDTWI